MAKLIWSLDPLAVSRLGRAAKKPPFSKEGKDHGQDRGPVQEPGLHLPGSEIYGGLANTWDYGPLGVELKNNVKKAWWKKFVQENPYNVGLDAAILMNPQTWVASGHVGGFSDPLMDCRECKERFRADKLIEEWCAGQGLGPGQAHRAFPRAR